MYHFCTYFDKNYLSRGVTLYRSLTACCEVPFRFYVLCLDQDTFDILSKLAEAEIIPIRLNDVEAWDAELHIAKQNRSLVEYYFTLSPVLPLYILEQFDVDIVTYLDADLMFFSSPTAIYDELGDASIFVTEHRFSKNLQECIKFGRFNVQCQSFRNDEVGLKCIQRWRNQCVNWCYDRLEDGKYADQKFLDEWPDLYGDNLVICKHPGIGVAPWNIESTTVRLQDDLMFVGESPMIFYHFAGFSMLSSRWVTTGVQSKWRLLEHVPLFQHYAKALETSVKMLRNLGLHADLYAKTRYEAQWWKRILVAGCNGGLLYLSGKL